MTNTSSDTTIAQNEAPPATEEEESPLLNTPKEIDVQGHEMLGNEQWEVQKAMAVYNRIKQKGFNASQKEMEVAGAEVVKKMRNVAATHTDPGIKKEWNDKADDFEQTSKIQRAILSSQIARGLVLMIGAPVVLAGAVVFIGGGALYGVGSVFKELGSLMTCGEVHSWLDEESPANSTDEERASSLCFIVLSG